jgi:hypothetical protein
MSVVNQLFDKGVSYNAAIEALETKHADSWKLFKEAKIDFKTIVQKLLKSGEGIASVLSEMNQSIENKEDVKTISNFTAKIKRFNKKIEKASVKETSVTLGQATKALEASYRSMRELPEHIEFRRAKKGIKGEEYVGYFKFLKQMVKSGEFTKEMVLPLQAQFAQAGIAKEAKVFKKIAHLKFDGP